MSDGIKDLSDVTNIPYYTLQKLFDRLSWIVCDNILEQQDKEFASVDIGIGRVDVFVADNEVKYRFIPSNKLQERIVESLSQNISPVQTCAEASLVKKIMNTYKDLF